MAKKTRAPGYLSPRKLLTEQEYAQYKAQQQIPRRQELLEKIKQGKTNIKRFAAQQRYAKSRTGRFSGFLQRNIKRAQRPQPVATALYERSIPITSRNVQQEYPSLPPRVLKGSSGGRPGRPRGTYDMRYKNFGGVYGYRRQLALQLRAKKLELMRRYQVSPQQQMVLNQAAFQQQQQMQNPEGRIIPSTGGQVPMRGIMDEINAACNIID